MKIQSEDAIEKRSEELALKLADKLERGEISIEDMAKAIESFLLNAN